jgi:hypothetical protein
VRAGHGDELGLDEEAGLGGEPGDGAREGGADVGGQVRAEVADGWWGLDAGVTLPGPDSWRPSPLTPPPPVPWTALPPRSGSIIAAGFAAGISVMAKPLPTVTSAAADIARASRTRIRDESAG